MKEFSVGELITLLQVFDEEAPVRVFDSYTGSISSIDSLYETSHGIAILEINGESK